MGEPPQRIWIEAGDECPYFYEESELTEVGSPVTEYIRADLCHRPAPAATDTGLVTVLERPYLGSLVARSQAEKLLAAERAEHDNTLATLFNNILREAELTDECTALKAENAALIHDLNRIKDHETELVNDNAAKDARIKELEEALDSDPSGSDLWRYWSRKARETSHKYADEVNHAEALEAKLVAAEKALEGLREKGRKVLDVLKAWEDDSDLINSGEIVADFRAVLGGKP